MDNTDYYACLGIDPSSSPDEIARVYRQLARQYHPDLNPDNADAVKRFKEINEAYQVLSDPEKRTQYDLQRATAYSPWPSEAVPADLSRDEQVGPFHHKIHVQVSGASELSAAVEQIAKEYAGQMQEALQAFRAELDSMTQSVRSDTRNPKRPPSFSPPPPPNGRPPRQGRPPRDGKPPKP